MQQIYQDQSSQLISFPLINQQSNKVYYSEDEDEVSNSPHQDTQQYSPNFNSELSIKPQIQYKQYYIEDTSYLQSGKTQSIQQKDEVHSSSEYENTFDSDSDYSINHDLETASIKKTSRKSSKQSTMSNTAQLSYGKQQQLRDGCKKQSELKNANKYFMNLMLNALNDMQHSSKYVENIIMNLKQSGKKKTKSDVFNLSHYRTMFLRFEEKNLLLLKDQDKKLHQQVFGVNLNLNNPAETIYQINVFKQELFQLASQYFMELKMRKNKMLNEKEEYLDWIDRVIKGISRMNQGQNVLKF